MKVYKDVDATRLQQRERPALNSVHRSSLLVPEIAGARAEIAFLNHFLIKRNYPHVGCRITAIDASGKRIESQLHPVRERRVYRFPLSEMFEGAAAYQIEFFAPENLFIPFPAVMVNHYGAGFINTVHAFNRVLNDVFEDDELTRVDLAESGIEVTLNDDVDTVVWLMAGMNKPEGLAELSLETAGHELHASVALELHRYGVQEISVSAAFPDAHNVEHGLLRVRLPHQAMFYGRVLAARKHRTSGAFSGNHSYYDTRELDETWDNAEPSSQLFAYGAGLRPRIRMHPEFPSGTALDLSVTFFDRSGNIVGAAPVIRMHSPGPFVELDIAALIAQCGLKDDVIGSFELAARPAQGNTLTRIAYHMAYDLGGLQGSSIIALGNANVKPRDPTKGRTWGQAVVGNGYGTMLAVAPTARGEKATQCSLEFYDERGPVATRSYTLPPNGGLVLDVERELATEMAQVLEQDRHLPVWFYLDADRSDINAHAVTYHRATGNATVEHTF